MGARPTEGLEKQGKVKMATWSNEEDRWIGRMTKEQKEKYGKGRIPKDGDYNKVENTEMDEEDELEADFSGEAATGGASSGYHPFAEEPIKREYANTGEPAVETGIGSEGPIPEPDYSAQAPSNGEGQPPEGYVNEELHDLGAEEKKKAAEYAVDTAFSMYKQLCDMIAKGVTLPKKKIMAMVERDEINLELPMPAPEGEEGYEMVTFGEFIEWFNESAPKKIAPPDSWFEEMREPLIEICIEMGVGLSAKQKVLFLFVQEVIRLGITSFMLFSMRSEIIKENKEAWATEVLEDAAPHALKYVVAR